MHDHRNRTIDYLKGVAILLVTFGHCIQYFEYANQSFWTDPAFKSVYMFHMPFFMALSGFAAGQSKPASVGTRIRRRSVALLLPCFTWALIYALLSSTFGHGMESFGELIARHSTALWFLICLFASWLVVLILEELKWDRIEVLAMASVTILVIPDFSIMAFFKYTFPFYCIGREAFRRGWRPGAPPKIAEVVVMLAFVAVFLASLVVWNDRSYVYVSGSNITAGNLENIALRFVAGLGGTGAAAILIGYLARFFPSRFVERLGQGSIYIYVLQIFMFSVVYRLIPGPMDMPGATIAIAVSAVLVAGALEAVGSLATYCWLLSICLFGRTGRPA